MGSCLMASPMCFTVCRNDERGRIGRRPVQGYRNKMAHPPVVVHEA